MKSNRDYRTKRFISYCFFIDCLCYTLTGLAQTKALAKNALSAYQRGAYAEAAGLYEQILQEKNNVTWLETCAISHYRNLNYSKACERFGQLFALNPNADSKNYRYAAECALYSGQFVKSLQYYQTGLTNVTANSVSDTFLLQKEALQLYTDSFALLVNTASTDTKAFNCIQLDASSSVDEGNPTLIFEWDFGDGTLLQGTSVEHCYLEPGTYTIQLNTLDKKSFLRREKDTSLTVSIKPKVLSIQTNAKAKLYIPNRLEALTTIPPAWKAISYFWDFEEEGKAFGLKVNHSFKNIKQAKINLTVCFKNTETDKLFLKSSSTYIEVVSDFNKSETLLEIEKQGGKGK